MIDLTHKFWYQNVKNTTEELEYRMLDVIWNSLWDQRDQVWNQIGIQIWSKTRDQILDLKL